MCADTSTPDAAVRAATRATAIAFAGSGFAFANWASRIPQVRDGLDLTPGELGRLLLAIAAGSLIALPLAGSIVARLGSRRTVVAMAVLLGIALALAGLGYLVGAPALVVGLVPLGFANGAWDVAMNVQGALVERRLGRSILSRFHAGYSLGTVAGALLGAAMVAIGLPVTAHLIGTGVIVVAVVPRAVRAFLVDDHSPLADAGASDIEPADVATRGALAAWRERRTLLVGLFVLAFAFAEGTGNDWVGVAFEDGHGTSKAVATLGFAVFLAAMTIGRWFGPMLLDRYGRVVVVRLLALLATIGVVVFAFGGSMVIAFVGAVLWGLGVSLGFPVGMSAGADDPTRAAARVSVIASIGYVAFLAGPPSIGFLADHFDVLHALLAVGVLLALAATIGGVVRPAPATTHCIADAGG